MAVADAVEAIVAKVPEQAEPCVIAVDGFSAAGKSTIGAALATYLGAALLHMDDFYRDMTDAERRALSAARGIDQYFDWPRLRTEALLPLRGAETACFAGFDWKAGIGLGPMHTVEPRPFIVLEGVYSGRPDLEDLVDLAVFVDAPADARRARRRARHDSHDWEARWDAAERLYFSEIRPASSFDVVVPGA